MHHGHSVIRISRSGRRCDRVVFSLPDHDPRAHRKNQSLIEAGQAELNTERDKKGRFKDIQSYQSALIVRTYDEKARKKNRSFEAEVPQSAPECLVPNLQTSQRLSFRRWDGNYADLKDSLIKIHHREGGQLPVSGIFFALVMNYWREDFMGKARFFLTILALSAAVTLLACGKSEEPKTTVPSPADAASPAPGAGSPAAANNSLEKAVKAKFESDEQLKMANIRIDADVTKNQVTLSGTVESEALRSKAVELAKSAQVGVIINDKLNVKARQSNTMPPMPRQAIVLV
jgi:hypothetical protein